MVKAVALYAKDAWVQPPPGVHKRKGEMKTSFILVDVEARGASPVNGTMTEFGAVDLFTDLDFHGKLVEATPDPDNPAIPYISVNAKRFDSHKVMTKFSSWLQSFKSDRIVFVSDNPAYDYMWIAGEFDQHGMTNPFGHSARRIGDLYAGLSGNWRNTSKWKGWRVTRHDHHPVNDARGNREALLRMLEEYNQKL